MSNKSRLVILASGSGTNLQAIIDACQSETLNAEVYVVISDKKKAFALERARKNNIPGIHHNWAHYKKNNQTRIMYDADLAKIVKEYAPDLIILAGWMRLLTMSFLSEFPNQVINLHPALPDTFPGIHAIERAYQAFQENKIKETGVMIHYVPDEGVDNGQVIRQEVIPICPDDTLEILENRIHQVEHRLLVEAIQKVIQEKKE